MTWIEDKSLERTGERNARDGDAEQYCDHLVEAARTPGLGQGYA